LQFDDCLWPRGESWYHNRRLLEAQAPEGIFFANYSPFSCILSYSSHPSRFRVILTRLPACAASSSSECDDSSDDDDQSFESCEQHSSANSPPLLSVESQALPSPSTVAAAGLARLSIESNNPVAAFAVDSPKSDIDTGSSCVAAVAQVETVDAASASVDSATSSSTLHSKHHAPGDGDQSASVARATDATDGTDDSDQGQVFDCFDLKIVYERGRTGFEDTKEIDFTPGMLIAVRVLLHWHAQSNMLCNVRPRVATNSFNSWTALCLAARFSVSILPMIVTSVSRLLSFWPANASGSLVIFSKLLLQVIKNSKDFFDQSLDEIKLLKLLQQHDPDDRKNVLQLHDFFYFKVVHLTVLRSARSFSLCVSG
jgi:hypothetical protein